MPLPLYVPTEEQLLHPSPGSYWDGAIGHSPKPKPVPWWGVLISVLCGLSPFIVAFIYVLTR